MEQALSALRTLLGPDQVRNDAATLAQYAMSTAAHGVSAHAVVYPDCSNKVINVVKIAAKYGVPMYPISTGRNWGYGDACPVQEHALIIDLSRMNQILAVDPVLAYAVIEPGVTQQQLSDYLRQRAYGLVADCTGAGPDTSFVGNILERGFGHSPYGDRFAHIAGMQIVLANGEVLHTGFGHYPGARANYVYPYGVGPSLDGLFTQSNFGVVIRTGIWLMPEPACIEHFICSVPRHDVVARVVEALRPLRLDGTLRSVVHIGNDLRVLSGGMTFPHERAKGATCLSASLRVSLRSELDIGAWTVSGALQGSKAQVAAARRALQMALHGIGLSATIITEAKLRMGTHLANWLGASASGQRLRAKLATGQALFDMNHGIPNGRFLAGAYWRRPGGLPPNFPNGANPARDGCGLLWVSPVLPMRGADLLEVHALIEPLFQEFQFDLFATFSMINERALSGVITIAFDPSNAAEAERAHQCYQAVFERLMRSGYIPYRVGNHSMGRLDPNGDVFWRTVSNIKTALDPAGLMAPGRYQAERKKGKGKELS